jgi:hypothetical protein
MNTTLIDKITYLTALAEQIHTDKKIQIAKERAEGANPFFTKAFIESALVGIASWLEKSKLENWIADYPFLNKEYTPKKVAIIMAGNIPLVGFHDFLCLYLTNHFIQIKTSSKDDFLFRAVLDKLCELDTNLATRVTLLERLTDFDAVIATGSDNSFRYFEYYFKNKPSLLRKNRNSVAILTGEETDEELEKLGDDIFLYFGLGCRNVSKLYVQNEFDITRLFPRFEKYNWMHHHTKYMNNYDYHRAIYLLNQQAHLADEKIMIIESQLISSPLSVVHYERFDEWNALDIKLNSQSNNIQCIVGGETTKKQIQTDGIIPFGQSQFPTLSDFADNVNTFLFLESLND